ncbi:MAG: ABC transporter permease [Acidobacteria bacterium]|nr:MAG: ABC transporter permease [Acidobacteriota bacterium]
MRWIYKLPLRLRSLFRKKRVEDELSDELRFHLEKLVEENVAKGMSAEEARYAALREFGGVERMKEECRDSWGVRFVSELGQDIHYGLRQLRRNPGFTVVAVLTLALGIGANTAIFSVVDAVLLKPLPYADPGRLVSVFESNTQRGIAADAFSYPIFTELRNQNSAFSEIAGTNAHDLTLTGAGEPTIVHTIVVTPEIFTLLGERPLAGRVFSAKDGVRGAAPVVVLSENLWRSHFGADPGILGKAINLDMRAFTVVGVMPADFRYPIRSENEDVWIPAIQDPLFSTFMPDPQGRFLITVARLHPGISISQAQAAMDEASIALARKYPKANAGWKIQLEPLQKGITGAAKPALLVLLGAVGLVLLIACANLANLLLARATVRTQEMAVRLAMGAGRRRILQQLLTESALLGFFGGLAGILLAYWGVRSLKALLPPGLPRAESISVDGGVLLFALALSVAASLIFGLAPALAASRSSFRTSLEEGAARAGESGGRRRLRSLLVAAEVALAVVLLVGAGLLIRSFMAMMNVNPGFNPQRVVTAEISLPRYQYSTPAQWTAFSNESLERILAAPGLNDSALVVPLPIATNSAIFPFSIPDHPAPAPGTSRQAHYAAISPGYFHVMEIPLLRGRLFSRQDAPSTPRVAIISQAFARRYFPNEDPIGQRLVFGFPPNDVVSRQIVGIAGDIRDVALSQQPGPMMYVPYAQAPFWGEIVVVRSSLGTAAVAGSIRRVVSGIDKNLPVTDTASLPQAMDSQASVAQPRFRTLLMGLFGMLALTLASVGIFGVMSYSVSRRTHEIGIRMALGATPPGVLRLLLAESARLVIAGLAVGIPAALLLTRFLAGMLYGVKPADPLTFIAVSIILVAVALLACYIPARRAAKVDPMVALRYE